MTNPNTLIERLQAIRGEIDVFNPDMRSAARSIFEAQEKVFKLLPEIINALEQSLHPPEGDRVEAVAPSLDTRLRHIAVECANLPGSGGYLHLDAQEAATIRAAITAYEASGVTEDTAWLIERRVQPPQWSIVRDPTGVGAFYSDVQRAHRFPSREAAEEAMRRMRITPEERGEYFVSEHMWIDGEPRSTAPATGWLSPRRETLDQACERITKTAIKESLAEIETEVDRRFGPASTGGGSVTGDGDPAC